ncbi:metallophosphoesterase [Pseudomonas sp. App30]|uniref:metallophosphoesterase family protein n=1 Tax=Pseudomonas sp. App30 TaxID=3068990 RepID=UPI003A7F7C16
MTTRHPTRHPRTDSLAAYAPSRRELLKCSAWAGAGVVWALSGGIPRAFALDSSGQPSDPKALATGFQFVQLSDSHIGFNKEANPEPLKTLQIAIDKVIALPVRPALILHTGDITHLSRPDEFDLADQAFKALPATVHYVPGEHDTLDEGGGKLYLQRYGKGTQGNGWYSFDDHGVHFIALVNVFNFQAGHEATLGSDQLAWLADDLRAVSKSTPVVVYTHIPLWTIYQPWGWGTEDGAQAIALLRDYGSVTVLNGHIHQVIQKVEGNITFHTARGTAYPQPAPGAAPNPGPMTVAADQLRNYLGLTEVRATQGDHPLALLDATLVTS